MSGLPEAEAVCGDEMGQDENAFLDLCEEHFTIKPSLAKSGCCRLGKHNNSSQPRKLLVHLTSEMSAATILREASELRMSDNPEFRTYVCINPDLPPAELHLAYEIRHRGFRLVPKSVTLNDLERLNDRYLAFFAEFGRFGGRLRQSGRR